MLNRRGEVVGIVTLGNLNFAQYGNFNFFLPISLAEELIASAKSPAPAVGEATASYREVADLLLEGKCESGRAKVAELQKLLASKFIDRVLGDCYRKEGGEKCTRILWRGASQLSLGLVFGRPRSGRRDRGRCVGGLAFSSATA